MPHSYTNVLIHYAFSTRERRKCIRTEWLPEVWAYMAGVEKNHDIPILKIGGMEDHAHVLLALPGTMTSAQAIQTLKANTSRWLRERIPDFEWQQGYGVFSVSASLASTVKEYIENQAEHHKQRTFEDEFLALLNKCGVLYDPKFVLG
jgi:REP element-mobilizing transposase RayT